MGTLATEINKAAEEIKKDIKPPANTKEEVETSQEEASDSEEASEEAEEETSDSEPDLSENELIESKNLYKALKNPQTANAVIAALAQQAGLLQGNKPPSEAEVKSAKREIKGILSDALGKEYAFLAERLAPGIEKVLEQERENSEQRFSEVQQNQIERDVVQSYERLSRETKGESKQFENRMAQLAEEIPIGNMNVDTYMRRLYVLASNERRTPPQKIADKIRRNASDAPSRLPSTGRVDRITVPDKKMNLDESVRWAIEQQRKGK